MKPEYGTEVQVPPPWHTVWTSEGNVQPYAPCQEAVTGDTPLTDHFRQLLGVTLFNLATFTPVGQHLKPPARSCYRISSDLSVPGQWSSEGVPWYLASGHWMQVPRVL